MIRDENVYMLMQYTTRHDSVKCRLGKLACPRVKDDQKSGVDDQKLNSSRPHDDWSFGELAL